MIDPLQPTRLSSTTTTAASPTSTTPGHLLKPAHKPSLARRSINLAQLLLSHNNPLKSPLRSAPAKITTQRPSHPVEAVASFECRVCERPISFNPAQTSRHPLACGTCGTLWDSPGIFLTHSPQPINQIQTLSPGLTISQDLLGRLKNLTLTPDQLEQFNRNPSEYLARLSKENSSEFDRCQEFHQLALTVVSDLFSSVSNLSNAFRTQPQSNLPSVELAKRFFDCICNGPGGRDILCSSLDQFLLHPIPQMVQIVSGWRSDVAPIFISGQDQYVEWAWAVILLECLVLLPSSKTPQQKRLVMTARLLGLTSFMPSRLHQQIIKFYGSCTTQSLREKVDLVNVFISERINYFLQVPHGFGPPDSSSEQQMQDTTNQLPKYMDDWSLLAASRVMTLLFESNLLSGENIPIEAFYNTSIDLIHPNDLIYDFEIWETRRSKYYTLCGYPSLLSLASKINILTYEGKRQMGMEARQALFDNLMRHSIAHPVLVLNIRRSHLIIDSLRQISLARDELKKLIKINFVDEDGVDGGGLKKEWFLLLTRQLVGPEYGMFIHNEENHQIWFNPASMEFDEFRLIGTILGLAIYNRVTLDIRLPLMIYRKLLGRQVSGLKDLSGLKPDVAKGLKWLLDYEGDDIEDISQRNFVAEYEAYGTIVEVPLIPGGEKIPVNQSNKKRFVDLYCDFILNKSIEQQFKAFKGGFDSITNVNGFTLFQPHEIELLLVGSNYQSKFNIKDLQSITTYEGFDPNKDLTIRLFWKVVDGFSFEDQRKLLRFMTGSDRIPAVGLSGLDLKITKSAHSAVTSASSSNNSNKKKSAINNHANERLPESHTCFNQLVLDQFTDFHQLDHKLRLAINESEGFSLT